MELEMELEMEQQQKEQKEQDRCSLLQEKQLRLPVLHLVRQDKLLIPPAGWWVV